MSVYKKLMDARLEMQDVPLKKSGRNDYAGYDYFTLADFLPEAQRIFRDHGLCGIVSFTAETATLEVVDIEKPDGARIVFTSPMGSANLKGCHEVQNIGAVESYQRRYLWMVAYEIVEPEALDATQGKPKGVKVKPTDGVMEGFNEEERAYLRKVAAETVAQFKESADAAAEYLAAQNLDTDEKAGVWSLLDSKVRSGIKKAMSAKKEAK